VNTRPELPEPAQVARPPPAPGPRGLARIRSAVERAYWDSREFLDSASERHAGALTFAGKERKSGKPMRLFYFGSGNHLAWVRDLAFSECELESERLRIPAWRARREVEAAAPRVDLVVADMPWPWERCLRGRGLVEVPAWINQRFELPGRWPDVFPRLRRSARGEDLRAIRKQGLTYRLVRDEVAIRRFYEEMYVPHLTARFGEAAYIEPEWKIRYCVDQGTLMEILRGEEVVAAQVLWGSRGSLHFLWAGAAGRGSGAEVRGIFPALYYYGLLHAFENGYDEADYCGSRPVLGDGIFQMKRRWGARVLDGWSRDSLFFGPRALEGACLDFLAHNAFVERRPEGLAGKLLLPGSAGAADVERALQQYASDGIREIAIYSREAPAPEALAAAAGSPGVRIVDLSREADPAAAYRTG
jgi:hypothetical protein